MSERKCPKEHHCDHVVGRKGGVGASYYLLYTCCHCGRGREQRIDPHPIGGGDQYAYKPDEHGPFAPNPNPWW